MSTESGDMNSSSQKGYVVAQVQITDREQYMNDYIPTALERIEAHGGSVLVGAETPHILEGEWDYNWTVVLEFPSVEDAKGWYNDETYEGVIPIRHDATEVGHMAVFPGFSPE